MLDTNKLRAIGMMVARQARSDAPDAAANEVIDMAPLLKPWQEGAYEAGDVVVYEGAPYKCAQAHDSTGNAGWNPQEAPALWANYHATDAAHALAYVQPTGAHDAYMSGEYAVYDGRVYRCIVDSTVHDPAVLPASWEAV